MNRFLVYLFGALFMLALLSTPVAAFAGLDPNLLALILSMLTSGVALAVELVRSRPIGMADHNDHELRLSNLEMGSRLSERVAILEHTTANIGHVYELNGKIDRIVMMLGEDGDDGEEAEASEAEGE